MKYFKEFQAVWQTHFSAQRFDFDVLQMPDGITEIAISVNENSFGQTNREQDYVSFLVQYAYNQLDYQEGVSFFSVNAKTGQKTRLLPKENSDANDTYGYSKLEIERLIKDIKELEVLDAQT